MSLAFLAKKSWHTANLRNVEKVWIAEQKHDAEEKKLAELRKNIEEERQLQELRQLQAANGNKSAALERVDWLYEGPMAAQSGNTTEEYLLGKEYKPDAAASDLKQLGTSKYGSLAPTKSALPANDAFSRLNEDPMMLIRKRQQAAHESVLKNPVKMGKIKAGVDKILSEKKARKKAKKEKKKEKKRARGEKKRKRGRSVASSDSDGGAGDNEDKDGDKLHALKRSAREFESDRFEDKSRGRDVSPVHERQRASDSHHARDRSRARGGRDEECGRGRSSPRRRHRGDRSRGRSPSYDRARRSKSRDEQRSVSSGTRGDRAFERTSRRSRSRSHSPRVDRKEQSRPEHAKRDSPNHRRRSVSPRRDSHRDSRNDRRARSPFQRNDRARGDRRAQRSPSRENIKRRRSRSPERQPRRRNDDAEERRHDQRRPEKRDDDSRSREPVKLTYSSAGERKKPIDGHKYGLISRDGAVECADIDTTTLGPNSKFLEIAREKRRKEDDERKQKLSKSSGPTQYSEEEKRRMAAQMVEDARQREEYIAKRGAQKSKELDDEELKANKNPHFLKEMQDAAYMGEGGEMSDRLRRNKHYIQRNADASNFMSK